VEVKEICAVYSLLCKISILINAFCFHSRYLSPCHSTPFQQFVNIDTWLTGLFHWLHTAGFASVPVQVQINSSPRGLGLDCKMKWGEVPNHSFLRCSYTHHQCGTLHVLVVGWYFPCNHFLLCDSVSTTI